MTEPTDTLPAWLAQRFDPRGPDWDNLDANDRNYWEHHARAVRRAVERGGFKSAASPTAAAVSGRADTLRWAADRIDSNSEISAAVHATALLRRLADEEPQQPTAGGSDEAEPDVASGQCGHDDYHDPHEWADRPGTWCPGHSVAEERS